MSNRNYLRVLFIGLLGFSSTHSIVKKAPLTRLRERIASKITEELNRRTLKKCAQVSVATAALIIVAQLFTPKENEKKSTPL